MGRCVVLEHLGAALYRIQIKRDIERLKKRLEDLKDRSKILIEEEKPAAEEKRDEEIAKLLAQEDALESKGSLTQREKIEIELKRHAISFKIAEINVELNIIEAEILSIDIESAQLEAVIKDPPATVAWCGDYTIALQPGAEYGTMELPSAQRRIPGPESLPPDLQGQTPVMLYPGWNDGGVHNAARDGKMQPVAASGPPAYYFNHALLPGWQKWRPTYRIGTITRLEGDSCDVVLDPVSVYAHRSIRKIDLNLRNELLEIPIQYMSCNGRAFALADRVVVQFKEQKPDDPVVIGFETHPKSCQYAFKAIFLDPVPDSDPPVNIFNTYSIQYAPSPPEPPPEDGSPPPPPLPDWKAEKVNGIKFGTISWQNASGSIVLTWWGPPNRYWIEAYSSEGWGLPEILYPGQIFGGDLDIRLVTPILISADGEPPQYKQESLYYQTAIFRDGVKIADAPASLYGCGVLDDSGGESGKRWLLAACAKHRTWGRKPVDWDVVNNRHLVPMDEGGYVHSEIYVHQTILYATDLDFPEEWVEIGRYEYDDSLEYEYFYGNYYGEYSAVVSTRLGHVSQKMQNHQPWFFSPSGKKACSIKTTEPFFGVSGEPSAYRYERRLVEISIVPPQPATLNDVGEIIAEAKLTPSATFFVHPQPLATASQSINGTAGVDSYDTHQWSSDPASTTTFESAVSGNCVFSYDSEIWYAFDYDKDDQLIGLKRTIDNYGTGTSSLSLGDLKAYVRRDGSLGDIDDWKYSAVKVADSMTGEESFQHNRFEKWELTSGFSGTREVIIDNSYPVTLNFSFTGYRPDAREDFNIETQGECIEKNNLGSVSPVVADLRNRFVMLGFSHKGPGLGLNGVWHWAVYLKGDWILSLRPHVANGGGLIDSPHPNPQNTIYPFYDETLTYQNWNDRFVNTSYAMSHFYNGDPPTNHNRNPMPLYHPVQYSSIVRAYGGEIGNEYTSTDGDGNVIAWRYFDSVAKMGFSSHLDEDDRTGSSSLIDINEDLEPDIQAGYYTTTQTDAKLVYFAYSQDELLLSITFGYGWQNYNSKLHHNTYAKGTDQPKLLLLDYNSDFARVSL